MVILPIYVFYATWRNLNRDFERLREYYAQKGKLKSKRWKPYRETEEDFEEEMDAIIPLDLDRD